MRVKKINLEAFGAHKGLSIDFKPGFNVVCGLNESGKSSLIEGIMTLLDGFQPPNASHTMIPIDGHQAVIKGQIEDQERVCDVERTLDKRPYGQVIEGARVKKIRNQQVDALSRLPQVSNRLLWHLDHRDLEAFVALKAWGDWQNMLVSHLLPEGTPPIDKIIDNLSQETKGIYTNHAYSKSLIAQEESDLKGLYKKRLDLIKAREDQAQVYEDYWQLKDTSQALKLKYQTLQEALDHTKQQRPYRLKEERLKRLDQILTSEENAFKLDPQPFIDWDQLKEDKEKTQSQLTAADHALRDHVSRKPTLSPRAQDFLDRLGPTLTDHFHHKVALAFDYIKCEDFMQQGLKSVGQEVDFSKLDWSRAKDLPYVFTQLVKAHHQGTPPVTDKDLKTTMILFGVLSGLIVGFSYLFYKDMGLLSLMVAAVGGLATLSAHVIAKKQAVKKSQRHDHKQMMDVLACIPLVKKWVTNPKMFGDQAHLRCQVLVDQVAKMADLKGQVDALYTPVFNEFSPDQVTLLKQLGQEATYNLFQQVVTYQNNLLDHNRLEGVLLKNQEALVNHLKNLTIKCDEVASNLCIMYKVDSPDRARANHQDLLALDTEGHTLRLELRLRPQALTPAENPYVAWSEDELVNAITSSQSDLETCLQKLGKAQALLSQLPDEEVGDYDVLIEEKSKKLQDLKAKYDDLVLMQYLFNHLRMAINALEQPDFIRACNQFLIDLTGGSVEQVLIDSQGEVKIKGRASAVFMTLSHLSSGTRGQLALSLKLALLSHLDPQGHVPLILDDAFLMFDVKRRQRAMRLLIKTAETRQVIYTSHWTRDVLLEDVPASAVIDLNTL